METQGGLNTWVPGWRALEHSDVLGEHIPGWNMSAQVRVFRALGCLDARKTTLIGSKYFCTPFKLFLGFLLGYCSL